MRQESSFETYNFLLVSKVMARPKLQLEETVEVVKAVDDQPLLPLPVAYPAETILMSRKPKDSSSLLMPCPRRDSLAPSEQVDPATVQETLAELSTKFSIAAVSSSSRQGEGPTVQANHSLNPTLRTFFRSLRKGTTFEFHLLLP